MNFFFFLILSVSLLGAEGLSQATAEASIQASPQVPAVSGVVLQQATQDFYARRFSEAEASLRQLIQEDPKNAPAGYLLVRVFIEANRPVDALKAAEHAVGTWTDKATAFVAVGDAWYRLGNFEEAANAYRKALEADPKNGRAHLGWGRTLASEFRTRSASEEFQMAYQLAPDDPDTAEALSSVLPHGPDRVALHRKYLRGATFRDPAELEAEGALLDLLSMRQNKKPFALAESPQRMTLPLRSVESGPANGPTAFLLRVKINDGPPRLLLVDSAAHGILVSERYAREAGVEPLMTYRVKGLGDEGRMESRLGWADSVTIGEAVFRDCPVVITKAAVGRRWGGIIGTDVLRDFLMTLDFQKSELRLERLSGQTGTQELTDRMIDRRPGYTPVRTAAGKLLVDTRLNGSPSSLFILDTGSFRSMAERRAADTWVRLFDSRVGVRGLSGRAMVVQEGRDVRMELGGVRFQEETIVVLDLSSLSYSTEVELGGLIGMSLLRDVRLVIDYRDGMIKIEK